MVIFVNKLALTHLKVAQTGTVLSLAPLEFRFLIWDR